MLKSIVNLLFPPSCCACNAIVSYESALCYKCWSKIRFLSDFYCCKICGSNTHYLEDNTTICISCESRPPIYKQARSIFLYDDMTSGMITRFKFSDSTGMSPVYARWIMRDCLSILKETDVLIPVPLHFFRLLRRKYNQSAILCNEIQKIYNIDINYNSLKRVKNNRPQVGLEYKTRINNVRGVFSIKNNNKIKNKIITLIDDVMTTGATINACTKELLRAGVKSVNVITLSRTSI